MCLNYIVLVCNAEKFLVPQDQPLHGWVLRRRIGSVADVTYKFPSRFTLQAGQEVTVGIGFVKLPQSSVLMLDVSRVL